MLLNVGRIKLAAACLKQQRRTITGAVNHANERVQFKRQFQVLEQFKLKLLKWQQMLMVKVLRIELLQILKTESTLELVKEIRTKKLNKRC